MRNLPLIGIASLAALTGCGLENLLSNSGRSAYERPASATTGTVTWSGTPLTTFVGIDGADNEVAPFQATSGGGRYEMRLPSATYQMLRAQGRAGALALRALVPTLGEETTLAVDLDARAVTETLIVEARLSADGKQFKLLTPEAYVGDGVTTGTRTLIRQAFDQPGPTRDLLQMVERLIGHADVTSGATDPDAFLVPVLAPDFRVTTSPLGLGFLPRSPFDYDLDGDADTDSAVFDATLGAVAQLYSPEGCVDPVNVRLVLSVDFNEGSLSGTCGTINRFKWANDKPDKKMYFVGWVHETSPIQDPAVNTLLGASVPNQLVMSDEGVNGDEVAGDGIWTISFVVPKGVRIGYKYTWGLRGQAWTGSEEWPGNSRILEVVDVNLDDFVAKRDVFGDEATNKDNANLNPASGGTIGWDTALHGCGPEAREQQVTPGSACGCGAWLTPTAIGPVTLACSGQ